MAIDSTLLTPLTAPLSTMPHPSLPPLSTTPGACESAPFAVPRYCASYVRHSAMPNARLELWPVLRPTTCQLRQHLVLVIEIHS